MNEINVVILADESARWKIAGLRQLDRLVLALNEFAAAIGAKVNLFIFWNPQIPSSNRQRPDRPQTANIRFVDQFASLPSSAYVLSTRLFVDRGGIAECFQRLSPAMIEQPIVDFPETWRRLEQALAGICHKSGAATGVSQFLTDPADIQRCERRFLRHLGKGQDGFVSRFLNRPVSRAVTRFLLPFPITPTVWTLSILILPVLCFVFFVRGNYVSIIIGTLLYHLHSILDGCDGEIARAKYLESKHGGRIDDLCDIFAAILFLVGLGLGLQRFYGSTAHSWLYAAEGILCAALIAINEWLLRVPKQETEVDSVMLKQALYPRHRRLLVESGLVNIGERFVWWLVQLTKRDVGILFFVLLALAGVPQWIVHIWLVVTIVDLVLAVTANARRSSSVPASSDSVP